MWVVQENPAFSILSVYLQGCQSPGGCQNFGTVHIDFGGVCGSETSSLAIDSRAGQIFSLVDAAKPAILQRSSAEPHSLAAISAPCSNVS